MCCWFQRRQKIARGVVNGLNVLHQQGFVHGEVNPQNIGVKADGSGVLLCPDFSRSLVSRFVLYTGQLITSKIVVLFE